MLSGLGHLLDGGLDRVAVVRHRLAVDAHDPHPDANATWQHSGDPMYRA